MNWLDDVVSGMWNALSRALLSDWFGAVGTFASIVGLLVTAWVAMKVRSISRNFLARARLPQLAKSIAKEYQKITDLLSDFANQRPAIMAAFAELLALVKVMEPKLPPAAKAGARSLMRKLYAVPREIDSDTAWDIHAGLAGLVTETRELLKDFAWSQK